MKLQTKILAGYLVLVAVICSMAAILVHERGRMQEIEAEATHVHRKPLQTLFSLQGLILILTQRIKARRASHPPSSPA